jgi:hypothetical protein
MPVRVMIHSSEVSSRVARSALVRIRSGTYVATAEMAARVGVAPGSGGVLESHPDWEVDATVRWMGTGDRGPRPGASGEV